jgi:hypothetical protein
MVVCLTLGRRTNRVDYRIRLPDTPDAFAGLDLNRDWSGDLKKAEAER